MIWYCIVFLFCFLCLLFCDWNKKNKLYNFLEILILIVLIIFSGTRYKIGGWDYEIYHNIFKMAPNLYDLSEGFNNYYNTEIGYLFFNSIIKTLGFNFYGFTLIHSIVFYILLYKGIKKFDINFKFFIIVFLYKTCIFNTFISLRQSLVLVIFINALYYLIKGKKYKYLLCIIPCLFIHTSSFILLPLVFLDKITFSKKSLIIYGIIFFVFLLLNIFNVYRFDFGKVIYFLSNKFNYFGKYLMYSENVTSINILSAIETYCVLIFIILFFNKVYLNNNFIENKMFCNLFLIVIPIVTLFRSTEVMIRFRDYFMFFESFVLYYIMSCFKNNSKKIYVLIVSLICFVGLFRYVYTYDDGVFALKNYKSYLFENISIFGDD